LEIRKVNIKLLNPAEYNPRIDLKKGDDEYNKLERSIKQFGYIDPIIWNEQTGNVVGGHQRLKILIDSGELEVEVSVVNLSIDDEKVLNVSLNKIAGGWENRKLSDLFEELKLAEVDISLTGFSDEEIAKIKAEFETNEIVDDDFDIDEALPEVPVSQEGDVWVLGKHRLMCGDSTSIDDVQALMAGVKARYIFTDPPWNVNYGANKKHPSYKPRTILNDKMSTEDFGSFLFSAFECMREVSEAGCMTYIVMSAQEWGNIMNVLTDLQYHWSSTIIWVKDRFVMSQKDYHTRYEPIWYGWKADAPRICPLDDRTKDDVWEVPRPKRSDEHPTMKPIELVAMAITNSSNVGDVGLDLFGGSGTTLIAAEETGRVCNMMELDPKYCDVIVKRYIQNTNDVATLIRDGVETKYLEL